MLYPLQEPQSILILSGQKHLHKAYHGHVLLMLKQKGNPFYFLMLWVWDRNYLDHHPCEYTPS